MKSRRGRIVSGLFLVAAVIGLVILLQSAAEQRSWASAEGTVQERLKSGKSASVRAEYPLADGGRQVAVLSENGPARQAGERVTVRYDLVDGRVADAALADDDQVFWVFGVMLGVVILGSGFMNLVLWVPGHEQD